MQEKFPGPPTIVDGGPRAVSGPAPVPGGFIDVPCSMLARDLAAVCGERWIRRREGYLLTAPKGSMAVVEGEDADHVVAVLRAAGPKSLQLFAATLAAWSTRGEVEVAELGAVLGTEDGRRGRWSVEDVLRLTRSLARVRFVSGPGTGGTGDSEPGPPIHLEERDRPRVAPSPAWVREFARRDLRIAKLPGSFLRLHAKNDRYAILLGWHLAIMLRVNRKHGYRYRVRLGTLLEGAGIPVPARNVGRFLAAIYRALEVLPGIRAQGPAHRLYASDRLLGSMFAFAPTQDLLLAYLPPAPESAIEAAVGTSGGAEGARGSHWPGAAAVNVTHSA